MDTNCLEMVNNFLIIFQLFHKSFPTILLLKLNILQDDKERKFSDDKICKDAPETIAFLKNLIGINFVLKFHTIKLFSISNFVPTDN